MARVGADEAGKGPVLGSMFAAAVRVRDGVRLPDGLADSKQLTPERRDALASQLRATAGVEIGLAEVPVERIDDPATDMNSLTVEAQAKALGEVAGANDEVWCDAADVDADRFARRVRDALETSGTGGLDIRAAHRADEDHPLVSAASVLAKVARDDHVAALTAEYGEIGSGYPGDPATVRFLEAYVERHGRLPGCARASWETSERLLAAREQAGLEDY